VALFSVSDARPECAITEYLLYKSTSAELTSADTDLYARLAGASYASDGAISIVTEIDSNLAELDVVFYIAAKTGDDSSALKPVITTVTPSFTVTLSCIDVTSITTAYTSNNGVPLVIDYTTDGFFYKIYVTELGSTSTVDLSSVATYVTDRPSDCLSTGIDIVTDIGGTTSLSGSVFSEVDFTLTIDTTASFYGPLYTKAITYVPTVFAVDKVLVTICG